MVNRRHDNQPPTNPSLNVGAQFVHGSQLTWIVGNIALP